MNPPSPASRVHGCLLGGAVGDALGAQVEFRSGEEIRSAHGPTDGIRVFLGPGRCNGYAEGRVSDDTQMTRWTAG
jgi:ADP-ribosylglycohydrolase